MPHAAPFPERDLRTAIASAFSWADVLRYLGYQVKGANYRTLQRWAREWNIPTDHFDAGVGKRRANRARMMPLEEAMVENSRYSRGKLKERLLAAGLKQLRCELCGQGDVWQGRRMSLVLDHINGVSNDHRLENLRMVCANCAATLDTHCGRNLPRERTCPSCGQVFAPRTIQHRYCSQACVGERNGEQLRGIPHPEARRVERPPYEQLVAELEAGNFCKVARKYGVSDNAVRKWLRFYERERERRPPDGAP